MGPAVCGRCHPQQQASQSASHHARALRPINDTPLPELLARDPVRERNGAVYRYSKVEGGVEVTVAKGAGTARMLLEWCFGDGSQGYTPVGRLGGRYVEHRVSWYRESGRPGLTAGHPSNTPADIESAMGIVQPPATITRCFTCHATGVGSGPDLTRIRPGVTCESCHGPGAEHVAAVRAGKPGRGSISNPRRLPAAGQVSVCAQCHRSPNVAFPTAMPELDDPVSIRFAPVGLQASACFRGSGTLTCVTCHDPHADPLPAGDPFYTAVCLRCHGDTPVPASSCPRTRKTNCVGCHMQRAAPLANLTFTDHRIRVYVE